MRNCSDIEPELSAYHDGELSPSERAVVQEHIANCPACQTALAAIEAARVELAALPKLKSSAGLRDRVKGQLAPKAAALPNRSANVTQGRFGWAALASGIAATAMLAILGYTYFSNPAGNTALKTAPTTPEKDAKNPEAEVAATMDAKSGARAPKDSLGKIATKDRVAVEDTIVPQRSETELRRDLPVAKGDLERAERKPAPAMNKDRSRQETVTEGAPAAPAPVRPRDPKKLEEDLEKGAANNAPAPAARPLAPTPTEPAVKPPGKPTELRANLQAPPAPPPAAEPPKSASAARAVEESRKPDDGAARYRADKLEKNITEKAKAEEPSKAIAGGGAAGEAAKKSEAADGVTREAKRSFEMKTAEATKKDENDVKLSIEPPVKQQQAGAQPDTGPAGDARAKGAEQKNEDPAGTNRRQRFGGGAGGGGGMGRGGAAPKQPEAPGLKPANPVPKEQSVTLHTTDVAATVRSLRTVAAAHNVVILSSDGKALDAVKLAADEDAYAKPDAKKPAAATTAPAPALKSLAHAEGKEEYLLTVDADAVTGLLNDLKLLQDEARGVAADKPAPARPPTTPTPPTVPPVKGPAQAPPVKEVEAEKEVDKGYKKTQAKVTIRVIIDSTPQK